MSNYSENIMIKRLIMSQFLCKNQLHAHSKQKKNMRWEYQPEKIKQYFLYTLTNEGVMSESRGNNSI